MATPLNIASKSPAGKGDRARPVNRHVYEPNFVDIKWKSKRAKDVFDGYICAACARERNATWPKGHVATKFEGVCPVCHKTAGLSAVSDWNGLGQEAGREL